MRNAGDSYELVNLTGQEIYLAGVHLPSMGHAKVHSHHIEVERIVVAGLEVPIFEVMEEEIQNLPEPHHGTLYIVSGVVAFAARRADVVSPSKAQRDRQGRVIGAQALSRPIPMYGG